MTDITMDIDTQALRQRILTLAIQGKLTDQRKEDGTAQDLYNQIQEEKQKLIKEKKIKKTKSLPKIEEDEIPFEIPENWMWVRLGDVCQINPRNHVEDENIDVSFLPMASIDEGYGSSYHPEIRKWKDVKKGFTHFANNDVVLAKISPCFQNLKSAFIHGLLNGIGAGTTELHVLRIFAHTIDAKYLLYFVQNPDLINAGVKTFKGVVGQQRISTDFIKEYLLPLPPLAEQKRIADKVSTLFAQLDAIDKAYEEYRELQQTMKSRLLEQAIQGKLTDQRKEDGNAQDLYKEIQEEKQKLIKEKKIKKTKPLPAITEDEIPFDIPENWMWVRLEDIIYTIGSKRNQIKEKEVLPKGIYKVVSQSKEPVIGYCNDQSKVLHIEKDCIVFGDHTALVKYINFDFVVGADGVKVWKTYSGIETKFLLFALKFYLQGISNRGGYSRHYKFIKDKLIPLPPLAEQKRIVEKLDKLLPLCEA